jgi:hypothetical protein
MSATALMAVLVMPAAARAIPALGGSGFRLFTDATETVPGLVGSYVNTNLASVQSHDDWRTTQTISGTRVDATLDFQHTNWGPRASVGITGGTDQDWEYFSVQWDGYVRIDVGGTQLVTESDDSSRLWIDLDGDGSFEPFFPEFINNHWGSPQAPTLGELSAPIPAGLYRIRVQYEEQYFGTWMRLTSVPPSTVRFAYLIPSNRTLPPDGTTRFQETVLVMHEWFAEQMDRLGLGRRSFRYETEADGSTPKVHTVSLAEPDAYFHPDIFGLVQSSAVVAGVPLWSPGEIWLLIPEIHLQAPDGTVTGGVALGGGGGSNGDAGVAMVPSASLALAGLDGLVDDRPYAGLTIPAIGPHPLAQDLSFPWFEGTTVSSVSSSFTGAMAHELGHAFGLAHDWRNDDNFHGNVMANGLRGIRGAVFPQLYGADDCRLEYASALSLSRSSYFTVFPPLAPTAPHARARKARRAARTPAPPSQATQRVTDPRHFGTNLRPCDAEHSATGRVAGLVTPATRSLGIASARPSVSITSAGTTTPGGTMSVAFTASDDNGLALALLRWDGNTIEEMTLTGTAASSEFQTAFYTPGVSGQYQVVLYDVDGNTTGAYVDVTPSAPANQAPQPRFRLTRSRSIVGDPVLLDASQSSDPGAPTALTAEWDLDDDGTFDTAADGDLTHELAGLGIGTRRVRVRIQDAMGAVTVSTAMAIRVEAATVGVADGPRAGVLQVRAVPSPFSRSTTVWFELARPGTVVMTIHDVTGRLVRRVEREALPAGRASLSWDGRDDSGRRLPSGSYFCRVRHDGATMTAGVELIR